MLLLFLGLGLTIGGVMAMDAASTDLAQTFTGAAQDQAAKMLVAGIFLLLAGVAGLLPKFRNKRELYADPYHHMEPSSPATTHVASGFRRIVSNSARRVITTASTRLRGKPGVDGCNSAELP